MTWKRLEGGAVDAELGEGVTARLADPLWLLARQWQVGEFRGEDAASPVLMTGTVQAVPVSDYRLVDASPPLVVERNQNGVPLETLVEREPVSVGPAATRLRLESGAALLRALAGARLPVPFRDALRTGYRLTDAIEDDLDPVGAAQLRMLTRLAPDGAAVAEAVTAGGGDPADLPELADLSPRNAGRAAGIIRSWLAQEAALFHDPEPEAPAAWSARRQEYGFGLGAETPAGTVELVAPEYPGGRLDWHHFDIGARPAPTGDRAPVRGLVRKQLTSLPVPLALAGMPASRWWEFEDGDVFFGDLPGGPEDLARSVIAAYAMVAGEDWYQLPCTLPTGSIAAVTQLRVRDNFGTTTTIEATAVNDSGERPWRWFELDGDPGPDRGQAPLLFLPPVVNTVEEGQPLEVVEFRRDEQANLGWAVEHRVEGVAGRPIDREKGNQPEPSRTEPDPDGRWRYQLATDVWDNWIPLVPVRIEADSPEVVLRRGTIAGAGDGDDGRDGGAHQARGEILEPDQVFVVNEEEIPSGGLRVTRRYQLARSADGEVHLWVGRRRRPSDGPLRRTPLRHDSLTGWR